MDMLMIQIIPSKDNIMKKIIYILCVTILALGCSRDRESADRDGTSGRITVSGAWALYPMMVKWASEYHKKYPDIIIDISAGGAGKGMADALSGSIDLGMVSRDINKAEVNKGAWEISVVKDAVIPMINESNPLREAIIKRGVSKKEFSGIWISGKLKNWSDLVKSDRILAIHVFTRSDACGAAETWAKYAGGAQEDLLGVGVYGDPGLADAVRSDPLGIGYNNVNFAYDANTKKPVKGIVPLPLDINGNGTIDPQENFYADRASLMKAIADNIFPSPPARDLHLVSHGVPRKKQVIRFLLWILDEGQIFVSEAGYIGIPKDQLKKQAELLSKKPD
jgi:phosphate transport system substrate-binding protein